MKSCEMDWSQDWKNFWMHFWVQDQKLLNGTPRIWYLVEILLFHVWSNDACKFAINLFPISWWWFEDVNLLYFLLKMQIWNGCNVFNIAGNPIKDINVNLLFLGSRWKVVKWTDPRIGKIFECISEFRIKSCWMEPPGSDIWWKFYFSMYGPMMHANLQ